MEFKIKKILKPKAHHIKSFMAVGSSGLTKNFINEVSSNLTSHELLKIKISSDTKSEKIKIAEQIAELTKSELIQIIGNQATFFKLNPEKNKYNI